MDHDERVVWLLDVVVEVEGLSWGIQIWVVTHDFRESGWLEIVILWDDGEWLMMMKWGDYQRALTVITKHQWELSHDFRGVDMTLLDEYQSLVLTMWDLESTMFEVVVKGWVAIISLSLFTLSPSHIELPVASPLSLTRARSLFFHHLIYLLHRVGDLVVLACYDWICHEF